MARKFFNSSRKIDFSRTLRLGFAVILLLTRSQLLCIRPLSFMSRISLHTRFQVLIFVRIVICLSWLWRRVIGETGTRISKEPVTVIFFYPEDDTRSLKCWNLFTKVHSVVTQKPATLITRRIFGMRLFHTYTHLHNSIFEPCWYPSALNLALFIRLCSLHCVCSFTPLDCLFLPYFIPVLRTVRHSLISTPTHFPSVSDVST